MSLIFDSFKTREDAERFARDVKAAFRRRTDVHDTLEEMTGTGNPLHKNDDGKLHDVFPWSLNPPIVLVERGNEVDDKRIEYLVEMYGGKFQGT